MDTAQRYDFELIEHRSSVPGWPGSYEWELQVKPDGFYVLYSDYSKLAESHKDLLEALEAFIEWAKKSGQYDKTDGIYSKALSAIAKARGEQGK